LMGSGAAGRRKSALMDSGSIPLGAGLFHRRRQHTSHCTALKSRKRTGSERAGNERSRRGAREDGLLRQHGRSVGRRGLGHVGGVLGSDRLDPSSGPGELRFVRADRRGLLLTVSIRMRMSNTKHLSSAHTVDAEDDDA
jgi:hypothetical protein